MTTQELKTQILQTKGTWFSVKYQKKNGEIRDINCRLGVKFALKGGTRNYADGDRFITVWERTGGYKALELASILEFRWRNKVLLPLKDVTLNANK